MLHKVKYLSIQNYKLNYKNVGNNIVDEIFSFTMVYLYSMCLKIKIKVVSKKLTFSFEILLSRIVTTSKIHNIIMNIINSSFMAP